MAPSTLFAAASLLAVAASGFYIPDFPGAEVGLGFVSIPVTSFRNSAVLRKRDDVKGTGNLPIPNMDKGNSGYSITISIGTPPQEVSVAVDTGSSELWVNPDCSLSSRASKTTDANGQVFEYVDNDWTDPEVCKKRGRYEKSKSSTAKDSDLDNRTLQYADSTTAELSYVSDTITIGGLTIKNQVFGVAGKSNGTGIGIMGFGPSHYGFNNTQPYPLILASMAQQGVISSPVFSLNLRDYDNSTGALIFGGIDTKRYTGDLVKIPFEKFARAGPDGSKPFQDTSYYLTVKSMELTKTDGSTKSYKLQDNGFPVVLDCGAGTNILPKGLSSELCTDLAGKVIAVDSCVVDCKIRTQPGGVKFRLNGKDIVVPYRNLISEHTQPEGQPPSCFLMSTESDHITPGILGVPFLRSAYAVFDWGNENLHIAQAADCGSNIKAVGSGAGAVPGGKGECKGNGVADSLAAREVGSLLLALGAALVAGFALL